MVQNIDDLNANITSASKIKVLKFVYSCFMGISIIHCVFLSPLVDRNWLNRYFDCQCDVTEGLAAKYVYVKHFHHRSYFYQCPFVWKVDVRPFQQSTVSKNRVNVGKCNYFWG